MDDSQAWDVCHSKHRPKLQHNNNKNNKNVTSPGQQLGFPRTYAMWEVHRQGRCVALKLCCPRTSTYFPVPSRGKRKLGEKWQK